jgi:hypothetical protein
MTAVNRYYSSTAVDTTLATGISATATSITVSSVVGFPTSYPYTLAIDYDTSSEELVNVVGASGTTLIVGTTVGVADITGRGVDQGSTYRQAHNAGAVVKHVISGRDLREPQEHIAATTSVHGITDTSTLVTASSTTVMTNKSLTAPVITGTADVTAGTIALGTTGSVTANSVTVTATQLGYVSGATSNIQSQFTTVNSTISGIGVWQDYTPTWSSASGGGTSWNYGTGNTVAGRYVQIGKTVHFKAKVTLGTTPTVGTNTGTFTLPVNPVDAFVTVNGYYKGSVATIDVTSQMTNGSTTATISPVTTNQYTGSATAYARFGGTVIAALSAHGITPTSGDIVFVSGTYEAA